VLDSRLRIPLDSQLVRSAQNDVLILCGTRADPDRTAALVAAGVAVLHIAQLKNRLDLSAVLDALATRNILSVLLECGSQLNGAFLEQKLVDKVVLFHAPTNLGEGAIPFASGFVSPSQLQQSLKNITRTTFGADLCITGLLHDPWE